ncbi:hypothetical protein ACTUVN_001629 [Pseudomonas caspiana]
MRPLLMILALTTLAGCAGPLPAVDPQQAWVDMRTRTGKLVMADKVDGQTTYDGRYFQVSPGNHKLQVRYDYEVRYGGFTAMGNEYTELTCFVEMKYDHFAAGQRYMIEVRSLTIDVTAELLDAQGKVLAEESSVNCI